jgi:hypothetical protein
MHNFKTLDTLHVSFPRALVAYYPDFLATSLNHLRVLYSTFSTYYLTGTDSVPTTSEDDTIELSHLLCPIIDFLAAVIRGGKARDWITDDNVLDVVSSVYAFVQMTDDDVMCTLSSPINSHLIE